MATKVVALAVLAPASFAAGQSSTTPVAAPTAPATVLTAAPLPSGRPMTNAEKIAVRQAVRRRSVLVLTQVTDSTGSRGSGFVVWRSGPTAVLLTNAHVVEPDGQRARAITVRPFGTSKPIPAYEVIALENKARGVDYAFLVAVDSAGALGDAVEVGTRPADGEDVIAVGNPLDEDFLVDAGVVNRVEETATGQAIYHSALIEHGSSGGGLFNARGQLVGINTYITTAPGETQQGIALATAPLLAQVRFHSVVVPATTDGWQESGILVRPGATLNVLATGTWRVSPWLSELRGGGLADPAYARYSVDPAFNHGALMLRVGPNGPAQAVDLWWKGAAPGATFTVVKPSDQLGTLRFRINDRDVANNSGRLAVTVVEWPGQRQ